MTEIYAARWVLPMESGGAGWIDGGEVVVENGQILDVRQRRTPASECRDFGDAAILPGLVNAHTHLEYTALRGFLEDVAFFSWIRALTASKAALDLDDWTASARLGALETLAGGVTTIGDNTDAGVTARVAAESGLGAVIYQEIFGIDHREAVALILDALRVKLAFHQKFASPRVKIGVSPHALYTIRPALFSLIADFVAAENLPTSIHIAESPAESALTERGSGPFAEMFARREIVWEVPKMTPTEYAVTMGALTKNALAVHCVHQTAEDIARVKQSGAAIVHCPKSNAKLGAGIAPLAEWLQTDGLRIGLGTDSAVSNNALDLWEEMRFALLLARAKSENVEAVTARQILETATLGGARAMGLSDKIGTLTPGKRADLIAVNLDAPHASPATDPYSALVYSARADDVRFTLCDGEVLFDDGVWPTLAKTEILTKARAAREKLRTA